MKNCRSNPDKDNILIAGKNFGCGSSREQAVYAIQYNDVRAVVAESFPDIFFRNSLNNGFCVVRAESTSEFVLGDRLDIDLESLEIRKDENSATKIVMSADERNLLASGGRLSEVKDRLRKRLLTTS